MQRLQRVDRPLWRRRRPPPTPPSTAARRAPCTPTPTRTRRRRGGLRTSRWSRAGDHSPARAARRRPTPSRRRARRPSPGRAPRAARDLLELLAQRERCHRRRRRTRRGSRELKEGRRSFWWSSVSGFAAGVREDARHAWRGAMGQRRRPSRRPPRFLARCAVASHPAALVARNAAHERRRGAARAAAVTTNGPSQRPRTRGSSAPHRTPARAALATAHALPHERRVRRAQPRRGHVVEVRRRRVAPLLVDDGSRVAGIEAAVGADQRRPVRVEALLADEVGRGLAAVEPAKVIEPARSSGCCRRSACPRGASRRATELRYSLTASRCRAALLLRKSSRYARAPPALNRFTEQIVHVVAGPPRRHSLNAYNAIDSNRAAGRAQRHDVRRPFGVRRRRRGLGAVAVRARAARVRQTHGCGRSRRPPRRAVSRSSRPPCRSASRASGGAAYSSATERGATRTASSSPCPRRDGRPPRAGSSPPREEERKRRQPAAVERRAGRERQFRLGVAQQPRREWRAGGVEGCGRRCPPFSSHLVGVGDRSAGCESDFKGQALPDCAAWKAI